MLMRIRMTLAAIMAAAFVLACGAQPESAGELEATDILLTGCVWVGTAGADSFCFLFEEEDDGSGFTGRILSVRDGKAYMELPVSSAGLVGAELSLEMSATGVSYLGIVDPVNGVIEGELGYPGGGGMEMDLFRTDPADIPGLAPMEGVSAGYWEYTAPDADAGGIHCGDLSGDSVASAEAELLVNGIMNGRAGLLHSLLVLHGGELVLEVYFHGYGREDLHGVASVTKSVGSLLVGLAVDEGFIEGAGTPLSEFFPGDADLFTGGKAEWTLRDLLTMSLGLDWPGDESETLHGTGPAFFREVLSRELVSAPGEHWLYVNAEADLLAGVIMSATGEQADAYAERKLFGPLGIDVYDWSGGRTDEYPQMDGTLMLKPLDMARIGQMVLDGGLWQGSRILSEGWIAESTAPVMETGDPAVSGYGYLWWTGRLPMLDEDTPFILANGWGSQFIVILPELDAVVVTTGGNQDTGMHLAIGELLPRFLAAL